MQLKFEINMDAFWLPYIGSHVVLIDPWRLNSSELLTCTFSLKLLCSPGIEKKLKLMSPSPLQALISTHGF